jgi:hypothetical protein
MGGLFSHLASILILNSKKAVGACFSRANVLMASMHFQRCVRRHRLSENSFPPCHWKRHHVLFLLVWSVLVVVRRFVTDSHFFFLLPTFLSLLS